MNIVEALSRLDPENDEHWTNDGMPRVEVVQGLAGDASIMRADINNASPGFDREVARNPAPISEPVVDEPVEEKPVTSRYEVVSAEIAELQAAKRVIDEQLAPLVQEQHALAAMQRTRWYDHQRDTDERMRYIRRQNEIRAQRNTGRPVLPQTIDDVMRTRPRPKRTPVE